MFNTRTGNSRGLEGTMFPKERGISPTRLPLDLDEITDFLHDAKRPYNGSSASALTLFMARIPWEPPKKGGIKGYFDSSEQFWHALWKGMVYFITGKTCSSGADETIMRDFDENSYVLIFWYCNYLRETEGNTRDKKMLWLDKYTPSSLAVHKKKVEGDPDFRNDVID
ncbi:hypothetical protein L1987_37328 [Smallanthus sonchifolius]|uniref:Uncharacterized protein n=1 Tax=Smallanthus sonchifolius TaxID=185202 RepID=A0ACB9HHG5_9ASTR|nr:hypothetical protein L1987_37328 [Smallanthus sonchifolius]